MNALRIQGSARALAILLSPESDTELVVAACTFLTRSCDERDRLRMFLQKLRDECPGDELSREHIHARIDAVLKRADNE